MSAFFAARVAKVCQLDLKKSFDIANAMIKACQAAFPKYEDLKTQYIQAYLKEMPDRQNLTKFPELYDLRQSFHQQLRANTGKKDNFR